VHLASAFVIAGATPPDTAFACWDGRLWDAASASGFRMVPSLRP
jgi:hypothetical protein